MNKKKFKREILTKRSSKMNQYIIETYTFLILTL